MNLGRIFGAVPNHWGNEAEQSGDGDVSTGGEVDESGFKGNVLLASEVFSENE